MMVIIVLVLMGIIEPVSFSLSKGHRKQSQNDLCSRFTQRMFNGLIIFFFKWGPSTSIILIPSLICTLQEATEMVKTFCVHLDSHQCNTLPLTNLRKQLGKKRIFYVYNPDHQFNLTLDLWETKGEREDIFFIPRSPGHSDLPLRKKQETWRPSTFINLPSV